MPGMPYKAHEKFIEDAKEKPVLFTPSSALRGTLCATSRHKRYMKMNIDGLKLAIEKLGEINSLGNNEWKDESER